MRYKLIIFDVDGTITKHISSWRFIHEKLGLWGALAHKYQDQFLAGKIDYRRFCELDAAHWKGIRVSRMRKIFREVEYSKNAKSALKVLKSKGFKLVAISTGIQFITDRIKNDFKFDYVLGNRLLSRNGALTGGVRINISHDAKGIILKSILRRFKVKAKEAISVGDSEGDIPLARLCGYSIAFNCVSDRLAKTVDYACKTRDFKEVAEIISGL